MRKLTTGQMIDQLGMEDVAISQSGYKVGYDHKGNLLMWGEKEEKPQITDGNQFSLFYSWAKNDRWEINYQFVDFEEAMSVHSREEKTVVYYHSEEQQYRFVHGETDHFKQLSQDSIGLDEITKGKWIVES